MMNVNSTVVLFKLLQIHMKEITAMFHTLLLRLVLASFCIMASAWMPVVAQTTLAGVKFDQEITLAGQNLQLNGAGVRIRAIFRVYAAALYSPTRASKNEDVLKLTPKRVHIVMLRDLKGDDFGKLLSRAIEDNSTREEFSKSIINVVRMGQIFAEAKNFNKGDVIFIDYVPGQGITISHRGKQMGEVFKEPEFHSVMMKIWFGPKPADEALRKAMLGEQTTANTNIF